MNERPRRRATATLIPTATPTRAPALLLLGLVAFAGCGREELLHGLDERQANRVVVALDRDGIAAEKRREEGSEGGWRVEVPASDAPRARGIVTEGELARPRPPGFAEVFGKTSVVPTASEERALYLHALSGELARTLQSIEGVVEARVHLALPPPDPLRPESAPPPRAAVLLKVRAGARGEVEPMAAGVRSLVAGAVPGLDAAAVSVLVAEGARSRPAAPPARTPRRTLLAGALLAALGGFALLSGGRGSAPLWRKLLELARRAATTGGAAPPPGDAP